MPLHSALEIRVTDVYGQAIAEPADLAVSRQNGPVIFRRRNTDCHQILRLTDLNQGAGAIFIVTIDTASYLPVSAFVNLPAAGLEVTYPLPFRPAAVSNIRFAAYDDLPAEARALLDGSAYLALDNERKAGLLNILAKAGKTVLPIGRSVLSFLTRLTRMERDRIFAEVPPELAETAKRAAELGLLRVVSASMHNPPTGYVNGPSYKSMERFGNLQITLFQSTGKPTIADIDIDNAAGLRHVFQVVSNAIHGPTHPYDIQAVLIATQQLDTLYTLLVGSGSAAQTSA